MSVRQTAVTMAVQPWFGDHCFDGKVVLHAVESMHLLAAEVARLHPEIDVRRMEDVRFGKFLEIPEESTGLQLLVEDVRDNNGSIQARLFSRVQYKKMTRLREHGRILFTARLNDRFCPVIESAFPRKPEVELSREDVYRDLVPFGPAYQTLYETLCLAGHYAWGRLRAPVLPGPDRGSEIFGSPFPLDGAFHAACVLGQCFADFVPFPVGFSRRIVCRPTQAGGSYMARVELTAQTGDELVFDLRIVDGRDRLYETVRDLRMRDVSGGRIKAPEWIRMEGENLSRSVSNETTRRVSG